MKKILVADDHAIARLGLKVNIQRRLSNVEIVECSGEAVLLHMTYHQYDLVIMEGKFGGNNSLITMKTILQDYPGTNVLIFSDCDENVYANRFLAAGAVGYISKSAPIDKIQQIVEKIIEGDLSTDTFLLNNILRQDQHRERTSRNSLSEREYEIASMLLEGQRLTSISKTKNLKISTVSTYKSRVFYKLGISSLLQLKEALYYTTGKKTLTVNDNGFPGNSLKEFQYINTLHM